MIVAEALATSTTTKTSTGGMRWYEGIQWHHGCALDCFHGTSLDGLRGFEKIFLANGLASQHIRLPVRLRVHSRHAI